MKRALIIPAEGMPSTLMVENTFDTIRDAVGGCFDCVRSKSFHGYVNDTGLIDGLPFNPIASVVFGQVICGDAILFGSFNAKGVYDGEEHAIDPAIIAGVKQQWFLFKTNSDAGVKL